MILITICHPHPEELGAARLDDLSLADRLEQSSASDDRIENPHGMPCDRCHEVAVLGGVYEEYRTPEDPSGLCTECHDECRVHPVTAGSPGGTGTMDGGNALPETAQDTEEITCLTCHYVHKKIDLFRRGLIRGDPADGEQRFKVVCSRCHRRGLEEYSPHSLENRTCQQCHERIPAPGDPPDDYLTRNPSFVCNFCHGVAGGEHYLAVNPFSDPDIQWRNEEVDIPLFKGRFSCISCHDPHATDRKKKKLLRRSYLELVSDSNRVNPHWKNIMCVTCHDGVPKKGEQRLRFDGDINRLCNRCHNNEFARMIIHPVGVAPSASVNIPPYMPLEEGKITCRTCHEAGLQESGENAGSVGRHNPMFLRGGLSVRNEFCFRCHIQELFVSLNAHDQLDSSGNIKESACLFCHTYNPRDRVIGIEDLTGFRDKDPVNYCIWCHTSQYFIKRHPMGAHLREPSRDILYNMDDAYDQFGVSLPLYNGVITCITCHDPHEQGVIEIDDVAGEDMFKRLRLGNRENTCVGCHGDK